MKRAVTGRSLRGNVDRNKNCELESADWEGVVPYVGTWIEIYKQYNMVPEFVRRSLRGNVDRNNLYIIRIDQCRVSFPTWERG